MLFYILFSIFYILVAWTKPKWALFLICALLPTYQLRFQILGLPTTFLEAMIIILFFVWLIKKLKNKDWKLEIGNWIFLIIAWLAVGLIAVFVSPDKWGALGHWRAYFLEPILLLIVFLDLAKRDRFSTPTSSTTSSMSNTILFGLSISALYISVWAIWQKIVGQGMASLETWQYPLVETIRSTGPFPQSNFLGLFLSPLILLFFGKFIELFQNKKLLLSTFYFLVSILSLLAIILAKSEGAILGVGAGLIFFLLLYLKKRPRLIFVTILLLIGVFLLFFSPWQKTIWQKITFQDLSLQMRLNIWRGAADLIKDHPIFGAGLRGYQKLISQYQQPFSLPDVEGVISNELHPYPHNLFLAIWAELGILGLIVFLLIIFKFFLDGFRKIKNQNIYHLSFVIWILAAMVVVLFHGLVDTPYFKNDLSIIFWLIVGLIIIHRHQD